MSDFSKLIDWQQPWLAPIRQTGELILRSANWRDALNAAASTLKLRNRSGLPIHFVPQSVLPAGTAYEAFIGSTGGVPTRENLHDFFNALVWLTFPNIKVQLNALQAAEIERLQRISSVESVNGSIRGKLRDGATIFDENAAIFITSDARRIQALRSHLWAELFVDRRDTFANECDVYLFGHALMEKLVTPYKAITAHAWVLLVEPCFFNMSPDEKVTWIDHVIATQLINGLATKDFTPLPVLGIPEWWPSQDHQFYKDGAVFRPARSPSLR